MIDSSRAADSKSATMHNMQDYTLQFEINYANSVHSILYVINKMGGSIKSYNLMKVLFAADKHHLVRYGRPITGDTYIKDTNGTVPKEIQNDIVNGKNLMPCLEKLGIDSLPFILSFINNDSILTSATLADMSYLSPAAQESLDIGIEEYGYLSYAEVREKNHQERCWKDTPKGKQIPFELMVDDEEVLEFLAENPYGVVV